MRYVVYVEVIYLHFCLHYLHFYLHYLHFCLHYLHFCLHYLHHLHTVATKPNSIRDAFAGHRESRFSVTPTSFTPSLYPHSLPAQHIICLYMQDNADEVQVVQAV